MMFKKLGKIIEARLPVFLQRQLEKMKPSWRSFKIWRRAYWKKYHVNKLLTLIFLSILLLGSSYLFYLAKTANVDTLNASLATNTEVYDEFNEKVSPLYGTKGTYVKLDKISPYVQKALIATEDRSFWKNPGFDVKGMARAAVRYVLNRGSAEGGGGSTITQQLAKNGFLTQAQTPDRKLRELFLAIELNKEYTKKEILQMYLNQNYFANGVWGVEDASHKYFGTDADKLSIGQAALLVGMLKGPSIYNPIDYPENAKNRRDTVLQIMVDQQVITQKEADEQAKISIKSLLKDDYYTSKEDYKYPSYYDAVINELINKYGMNEKDILNGGYKIYTTMNKGYQTAMQKTFSNNGYFPKSSVDGEYAQGASVALDPATGGIQALVGERGDPDKHTYRGLNRVTQMQRLPGSTIKPLVVYTPAIESGWKPDSILEDKPQSYYKVAQNYSRTYSGKVPMYEALAQSLNLPAVYLLHKISIEKGFESGVRFGLPLTEKDKYYGLALGGLEKGVSPLDMAQAYAVFGNGGEQVEAHLVRKVVDSTGRVVIDAKKQTKAITSKNVAKQMTSMMLGTFSNGTGVNANPPGYIMAGKTGTTETSFDASKTNDQWVIGYTPDVVIATWLGFDNPNQKKDHYLDGSSTEQASAIFQSEASQIMPLVSGKKFTDLYPDIQNAYAVAGKDIGPSESTGSFTQNTDDLRKKAEDYFDKAKGIAGRIKDGWDKLVNRFLGE